MQKTYKVEYTSPEGEDKLKVVRVSGSAGEQKAKTAISKLLEGQGISADDILLTPPGAPLDEIVGGRPYTVAYITVE